MNICFNKCKRVYVKPVFPALTGVIGGDIRAVSNYRRQWEVYETYAFAIDAKLMGCDLDNKDMGIGLLLYSDRSGEIGFSTNQVMLSYAYQRKFYKFNIGFGLQAGIGQKYFDLNSAVFPNQLTYSGAEKSAPSGETFTGTSYYYPDFSLGIISYYELDKTTSFFLGASLFHIFRPDVSFLTESKNKIGIRAVGTGGANIEIGKNMVVMPNFVIMSQNGASEFNIGSNISYQFPDIDNTKELFCGLWARNRDALIILTGFQLNKIRLALTMI